MKLSPSWALALVIGYTVLVINLSAQESPKRVLTPNEAGVEADVFEELIASDGTIIWMSEIKGTDWVACKNIREYVPLNALKGKEGWTDRVNLEEDLNRCVLADDGDLVYVGPADRDGVLTVSFQGRKDVHPTLAWFVNCGSLPRVARIICSYAE